MLHPGRTQAPTFILKPSDASRKQSAKLKVENHLVIRREANGLFSAGTIAVERLNTKFVTSSHSVPPAELDFPSTPIINALNAYSAKSVCDIWTVVNGGVVKLESRISSKPTTDKSRGMEMPYS